jgi:hypothetical protein
MKCPKCGNVDMDRERVEDIELDRCPACRGIFFDPGELQAVLARKLVDRVEGLPEILLDGTPRDRNAAHCDLCGVSMLAKRAPGEVRVDWCPSCKGVFLDSGELTVIEAMKP